MVDGEVYMYLHIDRLPSTTSTTNTMTTTSTPAPLFEEDPGSMTMHLALADFWKTLLSSYIKDDGEENVSVHTLLSPRCH